jgi:hypothetical protein
VLRKVHQNHLLFVDVNVDQDHFDTVFVVRLNVFVLVLIHTEFVFEMHFLMYQHHVLLTNVENIFVLSSPI